MYRMSIKAALIGIHILLTEQCTVCNCLISNENIFKVSIIWISKQDTYRHSSIYVVFASVVFILCPRINSVNGGMPVS